MGVGSVLTGLPVWKPTQLGWLTATFGGYQTARVLHFALMVGFVLFVPLHLVQVARAGWNNLRAMVVGYEVLKPVEETRDAELVLCAR